MLPLPVCRESLTQPVLLLGSKAQALLPFDIGAITLRPNIPATAFGTVIQAHPSVSTAFTLTLPNNPSALPSNSFLTLDASGAITAGPTVNAGLTTSNLSATAGILGTQIASATITGSNIAPVTITDSNIVAATITSAKLAPTGVTAGGYASADVTVNAQGQITAIANSNNYSGLYYPTFLQVGGAPGTLNAYGPSKYTRVGNVVTVFGMASGLVDNAANIWQTDVPIATNNFSNVYDAVGQTYYLSTLSAIPSTFQMIKPAIGTANVTINFTSTLGTRYVYFHYTYQIV
jgi:hypothetical protein